METAVITSVISGVFALATALGSVWLKHYLEQPRPASANTRPGIETPRPSPRQPRTHFALVARPVLVLLVSFAVGAAYCHYKLEAFAVVGPGTQESIAIAGLYTFIVVAFFGLVLIHRRSSTGFWPFQLDCLALWAAWTSGFLLVYGRIWSDVIVNAAMLWFGFALVGGSIVWFTRPRHPSTA